MNRIRTAVAAGALSVLALGCQSEQTTQGGVVGVDRKQPMTSLVSAKEIEQQASQEYSQLMAQAQKKGLLNQNPEQVQRVRTTAQRLIPHVSAFRPDALNWKWEANVLTSKDVNAWCMPGGKIAVYTGLLEKLRVTDDELAAVMGHEIAHALREHGRERASQQAAQNAVVGIGAAILGIGDAGASLANVVADVTFGLPYSREFEREADRIGVELAARAGYDPRGAVSVWQKMAKANDGGPPQFLSTHPSPENRIKDLEVYAQRVMPLYEAARKK